MKLKITKTQITRHIIQLIAFILFPGLFIMIYSSLKNIITALLNGTFAVCDFGTQIAVLAAVIPITVIFGRFFCGFLCSFGAMGDLLFFISGRIIKKRPRIPEKVDRILKWVKYGILVLLIIFVWLLGFKINETCDPWHVFGVYTNISGFSSASALLSIGGLLLLSIMVLSFFFERFFCRYLCPLGAIFAIISKFRLFKIKKVPNSCTECRLCNKNCPMNIPVSSSNKVDCAECIDCMKCVDSCHFKALKTNPAPALAGTVAAVAITGIYYAGNILTDLPQKSTSTQTEISDTVQTGKYKDGTYTGSANGYRGIIQVSVTVEGGCITDITVLSHQDDQQFFTKAKNSIISSIISKQSTVVTPVSGATYSSEGIINAVADALNEDSSVSNEGESFFENESDVLDSPDTSFDSSTTQTPDETELTDGVFSGTGKGFRGDVQVSVTVKGGKITDITVVSYQDDAPFFTRAQDDVINSIIASQSIKVDTVSGATFSSNGIIEAVSNALGFDFDNPNNSSQSHGHNGHGSGNKK